jgi:hypothetical protein
MEHTLETIILETIIQQLENIYNATNEKLLYLMKLADEEPDAEEKLIIIQRCLPFIEIQQPLIDFFLGYQEQLQAAYEANLMIKDAIKDLRCK